MSKSKIKKEEGFRANPYIDTTGNKTVGAGLNLNDSVTKRIVDRNGGNLDRAFDERYQLAQNDARQAHGRYYDAYPQGAKDVAIDMAYNLGLPRYLGFKNHIAAMQGGNWRTASKELMNSKYANQNSNRARRNSEALLALIQSVS